MNGGSAAKFGVKTDALVASRCSFFFFCLFVAGIASKSLIRCILNLVRGQLIHFHNRNMAVVTQCPRYVVPFMEKAAMLPFVLIILYQSMHEVTIRMSAVFFNPLTRIQAK